MDKQSLVEHQPDHDEHDHHDQEDQGNAGEGQYPESEILLDPHRQRCTAGHHGADSGEEDAGRQRGQNRGDGGRM